MLYSGVHENWVRLTIMHSIAHDYYKKTETHDMREKGCISEDGKLNLDVNAHLSMEKESYIVGMVIAWSAITLESYVNHALAQVINHKLSAIHAIESPDKFKLKPPSGINPQSELSKKLMILSDGADVPREILKFTEEISNSRNSIIHDKPFELSHDHEGNIEFDSFRSRGQPAKTYYMEDLDDFFPKCQKIADFIRSSGVDTVEGTELDFNSLLT